jgi:hypothetical protein
MLSAGRHATRGSVHCQHRPLSSQDDSPPARPTYVERPSARPTDHQTGQVVKSGHLAGAEATRWSWRAPSTGGWPPPRSIRCSLVCPRVCSWSLGPAKLSKWRQGGGSGGCLRGRRQQHRRLACPAILRRFLATPIGVGATVHIGPLWPRLTGRTSNCGRPGARL